MFKIVDEPTFTHTVTAHVPVDGGSEKQEFKATFKVIPVDQFDAYDVVGRQGSKEFLMAAVVSLADIADEKGEPLEYNDKLKAQVIDLPYGRNALLKAYLDGVSGARAGN